MPLLSTTPPTFRCDACGGVHVAFPGCCGVYARPQWSETATLCGACVQSSEQMEMAKRHASGESFACYVDGAGESVTIWTGASLGRIVARHPTGRRGWAGHASDYIKVQDAAGRCWFGYGSNGLHIALRPIRGRHR